MDNTGISFHRDLAGQTLEWFGSDHPDKYQYHLNHRFSELQEYGWIDSKFTYEFNQHGFRSEEFNGGDSVVFLGASDTLCTGMPLEESWPYRVASELKLKRYNLGLGGASGGTAYRMACHWLPILKPKIVVLMSPMNDRFELADDTLGERSYYQLGPNMLGTRSIYWRDFEDVQLKKELIRFYKMWASSEHNLEITQQKNNMAIAYITNSINAKFILADSFADCEKIAVDLARDLLHAGKKTNKIMADTILSRIS